MRRRHPSISKRMRGIFAHEVYLYCGYGSTGLGLDTQYLGVNFVVKIFLLIFDFFIFTKRPPFIGRRITTNLVNNNFRGSLRFRHIFQRISRLLFLQRKRTICTRGKLNCFHLVPDLWKRFDFEWRRTIRSFFLFLISAELF